MSDGTTIPTIMTDEKSQKKVAWDSDPANKYGHAGGKRMIEWCVLKWHFFHFYC